MALGIAKAESDNAWVLTVSGEVDLYSSPELRTEIAKAVGASKATVAVDLRDVTYMDSSGVATLVEGLRAGREKNTAFVLLAPSTPVMKVLELARLHTVFDIRDSL